MPNVKVKQFSMTETTNFSEFEISCRFSC